jgi:hypothetical protein
LGLSNNFWQRRGGDKAPVEVKAEAKARRYAPLIASLLKNVDESDPVRSDA